MRKVCACPDCHSVMRNEEKRLDVERLFFWLWEGSKFQGENRYKMLTVAEYRNIPFLKEYRTASALDYLADSGNVTYHWVHHNYAPPSEKRPHHSPRDPASYRRGEMILIWLKTRPSWLFGRCDIPGEPNKLIVAPRGRRPKDPVGRSQERHRKHAIKLSLTYTAILPALRELAMKDFRGTASELREAIGLAASPHAIGRMLGNSEQVLADDGVRVERSRSNGKNLIELSWHPESGALGEFLETHPRPMGSHVDDYPVMGA